MTSGSTAASTRAFVVKLFDNVKTQGLQKAFVPALANDLVWTATNTSPLAGRYEGKQAYIDGVLSRLNGKLDTEARSNVVVEMILVDTEGEWATVKFRTEGAKGKNGEDFSMTYCWLMRIGGGENNSDGGKIKEVIGFYDGVKLSKVFGLSM